MFLIIQSILVILLQHHVVRQIPLSIFEKLYDGYLDFIQKVAARTNFQTGI